MVVDNSRIRTGYDVEVMLGARYFLPVFQAAFDANVIRHSFEVVLGEPPQPPLVVSVGRPDFAAINTDNARNLSVTFSISTVLNGSAVELPATLDLLVSLNGTSLEIELVGFDAATRSTLVAFGITDEKLDEIEAELRDVVKKSVELLPGEDNPLLLPAFRVVSGDSDNERAFAIYINLDLKIAPQSGPPETGFIARGDADLGLSFLPKGKAFAIGASKNTLDRFANDSFHSFFVADEDGGRHVVTQGGKDVGELKFIKMKSSPGQIEIKVRFRAFVKNLPDAPVTLEVIVKGSAVDGQLRFNTVLDNFDADAGFLNDAISFIGAGLLGLVLFAIGAPLAVVAVVGAAGVLGVEVKANASAYENEQSAESTAGEISADFSKAFGAFPTSVFLFTDASDPFFSQHYSLKSFFRDVSIDANGMSLIGDAIISQATTFPVTQIVDSEAGDGPESRFGISTLTFALDNDLEHTHTLTMQDVFNRLGARLRRNILIKPVAVRSKDKIVKEIKFATGVTFTTQQVVDLKEHSVIAMAGFQVVEPQDSSAYVRGKPDESEENNLESLPQF